MVMAENVQIKLKENKMSFLETLKNAEIGKQARDMSLVDKAMQEGLALHNAMMMREREAAARQAMAQQQGMQQQQYGSYPQQGMQQQPQMQQPQQGTPNTLAVLEEQLLGVARNKQNTDRMLGLAGYGR